MDRRTEKTIRSYDRVAQAYNRHNRTGKFWQRELHQFKRLLPGPRVLEVGCGAGRDAVELQKLGLKYVGIDASRGLLRVARRLDPTGDYRYMDLYSLGFPPRSFDGVWTMATLLHVPKRRLPKVLRSIRRLLVTGGVMAVSIKERRDVDEALIHQDKYGGVDRFFAFYTMKEFSLLLKKTGWKIHETFKQPEDNNMWLSYIVEKE